MGVKSTVRLSRAEAELRWVQFMLGTERKAFERAVAQLEDDDLETALERLNDRAHGGEGFENYLIDAALKEKPE